MPPEPDHFPHSREGGSPPRPVLWFLKQISDSTSDGHALDLGYAGRVLIPLLGYSRRDLLHILTDALMRPVPFAILSEQMRLQDRGIIEPYILPFSSTKGHTVDIQVCPRPINLPDGTETITATLSLAPAKIDQQRAVQAERDRLLALLDRLPAFVCLVAPDYSLRYANQTFNELFGKPDSRPCYTVIKGEERPCNVCAPFDVFDTGSLSIYEWTSQCTDQSFRIYCYPFTDEDNSSLVLKLGIDITQSKQVQEALTLSEERYRSITDNLAVGIAVFDKNMQISAANPLFSEWFSAPVTFGPSTEEAQHQFRPLFHAMAPSETTPDAPSAATILSGQSATQDHAATPLSLVRLTFADGEVHEQEFTCLQSDTEHSYHITACPIRGTSGNANSVILLLEDITERKRVAERLSRARQLEAMGTLAAGIAHEINQPLSALRLYTSGLEMMVEQHAIPQRTLLARLGWILREADTIQEIISHMRSLVMQQDAPSIGQASVNKAVERSLGLVGAQLQAHGIRVELNLSDELPYALANFVQLEQVMINLVVNAMHALDTLTATDQADKWIKITTELADCDAVRIIVTDNGPGLHGLEKRIFDPFFTTKGGGAGMGLGLSIVHTFVESWKGEITTSTATQGGGATFIITLRKAEHATGEMDAYSHS